MTMGLCNRNTIFPIIGIFPSARIPILKTRNLWQHIFDMTWSDPEISIKSGSLSMEPFLIMDHFFMLLHEHLMYGIQSWVVGSGWWATNVAVKWNNYISQTLWDIKKDKRCLHVENDPWASTSSQDFDYKNTLILGDMSIWIPSCATNNWLMWLQWINKPINTLIFFNNNNRH